MGTRPRLAAVKDREVNVNIMVKSSYMLYMLRKCKGLLPAKTLSLLYKSIIAPHMDYCDTIWATCNVNDSDMIQKLQNRAANIMLNGWIPALKLFLI